MWDAESRGACAVAEAAAGRYKCITTSSGVGFRNSADFNDRSGGGVASGETVTAIEESADGKWIKVAAHGGKWLPVVNPDGDVWFSPVLKIELADGSTAERTLSDLKVRRSSSTSSPTRAHLVV